MDPFFSFFFAIWLSVLGFVLWSLLTPQGRIFSIKMSFGATVIHDYGIISSQEIGFLTPRTQNLRLFKCQGKKDIFYLIEVSDSVFFSLRRSWVKIDEKTATKMLEHMKS